MTDEWQLLLPITHAASLSPRVTQAQQRCELTQICLHHGGQFTLPLQKPCCKQPAQRVGCRGALSYEHSKCVSSYEHEQLHSMPPSLMSSDAAIIDQSSTLSRQKCGNASLGQVNALTASTALCRAPCCRIDGLNHKHCTLSLTLEIHSLLCIITWTPLLSRRSR